MEMLIPSTELAGKVMYLEKLLADKEREHSLEKAMLVKRLRILDISIKEYRKKAALMKSKIKMVYYEKNLTLESLQSKSVSEISTLTSALKENEQRMIKLKQEQKEKEQVMEKTIDNSESLCRSLLSEKEDLIKKYRDQIDFLKNDYRELEEHQTGFSLDFIKSSFSKLLCNLPIFELETENLFGLIIKMLGFSPYEKQKINEIRGQVTTAQKGFFSRILRRNSTSRSKTKEHKKMISECRQFTRSRN